MSKENIKNVEFINHKIIDTLNIISNEYLVPFDYLVNLAVLKLIDDVNILRNVRNDQLDLVYLSEKILS